MPIAVGAPCVADLFNSKRSANPCSERTRVGTTCHAKKPTDFGSDPDGSLISNLVPSIQYTAPKEVFFAESR
jgi:hypothetical protein